MNFISIIDETIYNLIIKMLNTNVTAVMMFISYLGSAVTLITLSIAFLLLFKNKKYPKFIILNLILVFILSRILKLIIARPRPQVLKLVLENGYSFPSGHSMISAAFYGLIIYFIWKNVKNTKLKYISCILLALLILLIGVSRIYLGVHYATDVIGGFIIGFIYLVVFIKYLYNRKIKKL